MVALNPSTSPGSASFTIMVLPLGELMESFTLPWQSTKMPRGSCPSTNSTAPGGYAVANFMSSKACSMVGGRLQKIRSARSLQVMQLSTISIPYGECIYQPPMSEVSVHRDESLGCAAGHTPL